MFFARASHGLDCTLPRPCHLLPMTNETRKRRWPTWFWERRSFCCCVAVWYCYCCGCSNPALQGKLCTVYYIHNILYLYNTYLYIHIMCRWVGHMLPGISIIAPFTCVCVLFMIYIFGCDVLHKQNTWMNSNRSDFPNWVLTWCDFVKLDGCAAQARRVGTTPSLTCHRTCSVLSSWDMLAAVPFDDFNR